MKQKFLKDDGSIEEGEPLTDSQASMFEHLTEYLHDSVCRHSYHGYSEKKPCVEAARLITVVTTTIDQSEWGEVFEEKVHPPQPDPAVEQPVAAVEKSDIPF